METKQGYFDPKMGFPLDVRLVAPDTASILNIPVTARFLGLEVYSVADKNWFAWKNGLADGDLELSRTGGGGVLLADGRGTTARDGNKAYWMQALVQL